MKNKIKHYIKELALFIIIITVLANAISLYKSSDLNKEPLSLTNITLHNGLKYTLSDTKPTLIHIWAIWCPTCKVEASNIQTLSKHYNVLTVAVKSGSDDEIQSWLLENNYNFNVINDSSGLIASNFNVSVFPSTLIYDKNQELVFSDVGYTSTWGLFLRMWSATYFNL
ncbi:MAG: redoxin domain-containing protein [Helicobacteraceae bacterium]|nr:redoxin domain-containing protein [Candidatus Sulfurimonas ponti]MBL6972758.1 redoxin domain-containing protein [Sulfurimonas sp.]